MLRIRLLAVLMLLLSACGGGGESSTPIAVSTCSNGATDFPTCTPPGVASGMKPAPVFLKEGDVMHLSIAGLGEQKQKVVPYK